MEGEGPGLGRQAHTTPGDAGRAQDTGWAGCPLPAEGLLAASITEVSFPSALSSPNLLNLILDHTQKLGERCEG